jgi:hypothetical protein
VKTVARLFFQQQIKKKRNMPEDVMNAMRFIVMKLKGYSHYRAYEEVEGKRFLVSLLKINGKWSVSITQV